jgi:hypothetical protein
VPARTVIVNDTLEFCDRTVASLGPAGHDVIAFIGSMAAIGALDASEPVEVLLPRALLPVGPADWWSLARMESGKKPVEDPVH